MIVSRTYYLVLALLTAGSLALVFAATSVSNRDAERVLQDDLLNDSARVELTLKLDARARLDALSPGGTDPALGEALAAANASGTAKPGVRVVLAARKALVALREAMPAGARSEALFAVNRDGAVLAEVGYEAVASNPDFELGGYPAVDDALRGYARDDVWVLGETTYLVAAHPAPAGGALVAIKAVTPAFIADLGQRTRASIAFFSASDDAVSVAVASELDRERWKQAGADLKSVTAATYGPDGRTAPRMFSRNVGAVYARLHGDAGLLGGGYAVLETKASLGGPSSVLARLGGGDGILAEVPWLPLAAFAFLAALLGIACTFIEHTAPLMEFMAQSNRLKSGARDNLEIGRFRGVYRRVAESLAQGIERAQKLAPRSAPAFTASPKERAERQELPLLAPRDGGMTDAPRPRPALPGLPRVTAHGTTGVNSYAALENTPDTTAMSATSPAPALAPPSMDSRAAAATTPTVPPRRNGTTPPLPGLPTVPSSRESTGLRATESSPPADAARISLSKLKPAARRPETDDATLLLPASDDLLAGANPQETPSEPSIRSAGVTARPGPKRPPATATAVRVLDEDWAVLESLRGHGQAADLTAALAAPAEVLAEALRAEVSPESKEWRAVYDEYLQAKRQCGEATEGFTFESFSRGLLKNRDAIVQQHKCKRVKFAVYVKDGKAALKANPMPG